MAGIHHMGCCCCVDACGNDCAFDNNGGTAVISGTGGCVGPVCNVDGVYTHTTYSDFSPTVCVWEYEITPSLPVALRWRPLQELWEVVVGYPSTQYAAINLPCLTFNCNSDTGHFEGSVVLQPSGGCQPGCSTGSITFS